MSSPADCDSYCKASKGKLKMNMKKYCRKDYGKWGQGGLLNGGLRVTCVTVSLRSMKYFAQESTPFCVREAKGAWILPTALHRASGSVGAIKAGISILDTVRSVQRAMWLQTTRSLSGLLCPHSYPGIVSSLWLGEAKLSSITVGGGCWTLVDSLEPRLGETSML